MNTEIALTLLRSALAEHRGRTYAELARAIGHVDVRVVRGADGRDYQIEIEAVWDDRPGGVVRVLGAIDDGGALAWLPLCDDFLMAPDGRLIGEP